jgi:integrase/recombinase XerD
MTPLRQRMLHELQRRNDSPSTIRGYLNAVSQFAEYFHRWPEQLGPEHLRRYRRYLLQGRKLAPSTVETRISALRFLCKRTLKRKDLAFDDLIFPKVPHKLPTVLSQEEVVRLIDAAPNRLYRILLGADLCHRSTQGGSGTDHGGGHRQPAHGDPHPPGQGSEGPRCATLTQAARRAA